MRRTVALVLCLSAAGLAQQRSPFFARVVGGDREPIADAEVTCVASADLVVVGDTDIVSGTSDARGQARCNLVVGRLYVAWAIGPADDQGVRLVSEPVPLVAAGRVVELQALDRRAPQRVRCAGLAAWREVGAAGLRWFPEAGQDVAVDLPWPEGDEVLLPPSPWASGCLAVRDASNEVLVTTRVDPGAVVLPEFAKPIALVVRVRGHGAPIEGARIEHAIRRESPTRQLFAHPFLGPRSRRLAGTTGADGAVRIHVPQPPEFNVLGKVRVGSLILRASKPGLGWQHQAIRADAVVTFELALPPPTRVRVLGAGAPLQLAALGSYYLSIDPSSATYGQDLLDVEQQEEASWLVWVPERGFLPRFAWPGRVPTAVVADHVPKPMPEVTIDLATMAAIDVRVTSLSGDPVAAAIGVSRVTEGHPVYWDSTLATDVAGRAELRLPPGDFFVYATTGRAHALAFVDPASPGPLLLRLENLPSMRVLVVDADGKPVAGARANGTSSSYRSPSSDSLQQQWDRLGFQAWSMYASMARSSADGVLQIPVFVRSGSKANVKVVAGRRESREFALEPGGGTKVEMRE